MGPGGTTNKLVDLYHADPCPSLNDRQQGHAKAVTPFASIDAASQRTGLHLA
jgi:hypothetical protein